MSRITIRDLAPDEASSAATRLVRLLEAPALASVVPLLPPETLHQLIRQHGLEACGDLITTATPAQLTGLLDLDLWRPLQPGHDGQFDVDRFGEWLDVLVATGPSVAARTIAALDRDVVVAGLCRYVRVFDPGIFEPTAQSDDELIDRREAMREGDVMDRAALPHESSGDWLECEVGGYLVRARRADVWDAIVVVLTALDAEHTTCFHAVMQACRGLSNSRPEIDGLDDLLMAPEQHLNDVAVARELRQSRQGYATPADARAFLEMARQAARRPTGVPATEAFTAHPIVVAYFRAADEADGTGDERAQLLTRWLMSPSALADMAEAPERVADLLDVLTAAGLLQAHAPSLLAAADADSHAARLTRLRAVMAAARESGEAAYVRRNRELAFLANTLLAGCSLQARPFSPLEASEAAASICNLGLEALEDEACLGEHALVTAFEVGWSVLHRDVGMFATNALIAALDDLHVSDEELQQDLLALRRSLAKHGAAGTPWLARSAADVLAAFDMTAWASVLGLLDECPVVAAALSAILDGRTTAVSPTAFEFIATSAQIADVRAFLRTLPTLLTP